MNKIEIEVPINVRYISEWGDFDITLLQGHSIINKTITGCGFTHYTLTNDIPTILCSPRKFLLENKFKQIKGLYLVVNSGEKSLDIDGESKEKTKSLSNLTDNNLDFENILEIQGNLRTYIFNCRVSNKAPKILVTYDSLKYVIEVLEKELQYYSIIVDEFQNIFMDASFKADTELSFLSYLQSCPNVTYLSATPYIEEYLNELDEFKSLPYHELKWHPDRLEMIKIEPKKSYHLSKDIDLIVQDYLNFRFPEKVDDFGKVHQSKEVVFYTNSVKMICNIIKRNGLTQDNTNIICADTEKNKKVLKKIKFDIGTAPLEGQPHKMFTFCTRTTYAGADFYSTSAISVIVSDCSIDSLATDIRMDFPQIMGRQRLKENVFRDECIFIYKLSDKDITLEEFEKQKRAKLELSEVDLQNFSVISNNFLETKNKARFLDDIRRRIKIERYSGDYTGIDERTGKPVVNKLVMISERRAFELRSNVYKNEVQVYNEFAKITSDLSYDEFKRKEGELNNLKIFCSNTGSFELKMKAICDLLLNPIWYGKIHISDIYWLPRNYRNYLNYLGPEKIRSSNYYEASLKQEISRLQFGDGRDLVKSSFSKEFIISEKYTLKEIKEKIRIIYNSLGILKTPKATDILEYFEVREYSSVDKISKKRVRGYEILSLK